MLPSWQTFQFPVWVTWVGRMAMEDSNEGSSPDDELVVGPVFNLFGGGSDDSFSLFMILYKYCTVSPRSIFCNV